MASTSTTMARRFQVVALFMIIMTLLGYGFQQAGLAGVWSDPVSGFRAQDETTYAASAVVMATGDGWMTPKVLGRFYLVKPPLLIWFAGLSMRALGISLFAFRLPVRLAGSLATLLLFFWAERRSSRFTAAAVVLLAVSNPLWHTFSRIAYTDMLADIEHGWSIVDLQPGLDLVPTPQHILVWRVPGGHSGGIA